MVEFITGERAIERTGCDEQMAAHAGLVQWVARRQWHGDLAFEEVIQAGRIGLWHALRGYDPSRGTRFSSYAVPAIARAVWAAVGRCRSEREGAEPAWFDGSPEFDDLTENLDRTQRASALRATVADLPDRLRQVIVAHYGLGERAPESFAQIGRQLGVSRQRVQHLHVSALLWLAHPDHSRAVRRLLERQQRGDYQQALVRQRQFGRAQRGAGRVGR